MFNNQLNNGAINEVAAGENNQHEVTSFNQLFVDERKSNVTSGGNQLSKTAQLTAVASRIADDVIGFMKENFEDYSDKMLASQQSHDAMDDLIDELGDLHNVDHSFLSDLTEDEVDKMIRSQQSKRSRAKSKEMTLDNYHTMMTGAAAEILLRLSSGKLKSTGGNHTLGEIAFSEEDLEVFRDNPDELKKAIRNIQSKKSIMKSKQGFSEDAPRWQQLLAAEKQLKELRDSLNGIVATQTKEIVQKQAAVEELLASADVEDLPADQALELLNKVKEMLASN